MEVMKIMVTSSKGPLLPLLHSMPPVLQQATANPHLRLRLLIFTGKSGLISCGSLLLSPGSWYAQGFVCALQESVSQFCVSSGGSTVGLMVNSSKRAYTILRSAAPSAPPPVAGHC